MKNFAGRHFGRWTVGASCITEDGQRKWQCTCECGTRRYVNETNLLSGKTKSCGCLSREKASGRYKDLTGQTFGQLFVEGRAQNRGGRTAWNCRCACGNTCVVRGHELLQGKTKSCGCLLHRKGVHIRDIRGIYGWLTALYPTEERDYKGSVIWHCRCNCGRELDLPEDDITSGSHRSCGCKRKENGKKLTGYLHFYEGTCLEYLSRKKRRDNKTGVTGVSRMKNGGYTAGICFRGKRYSLGRYETLEDAARVRKQAEEELFLPFAEAYGRWKREKEAGKGKERLEFEVRFQGGVFSIYSNYLSWHGRFKERGV